MSRIRPVVRTFDSIRTEEGEGFIVRRPFPSRTVDHIDPFLLVDEMGPIELAPGEAKGAPDHPHRGFETVSYVLDGEMEHEDSAGNRGSIGAGDVQWMTAGDGVVHSEMPSRKLQQSGGRMHGFQVWVNLPASAKRIPPRYQEVPKRLIPWVESADGKAVVRIVAGAALGAKSPVETHTPIAYFHATVRPGGRLELPVPEAWNAFVYVVRGSPVVSDRPEKAVEGQILLLGQAGDTVSISLPDDAPEAADVLVLGGQPIGEPVARYGPFVMNTREEIMEAFSDFRSGRFGQIRR